MNSLIEVIIEALKQFIEDLLNEVPSVIESNVEAVIKTIVGTPRPDSVFTRPTNNAWPAMYDQYWEFIFPLALLLWGLSIGIVIFLESTSYLFSGYHRSKLKKRAFSGLLGILFWWWIAALSLRFMEALTGYLVPDISDITLFETLSFGTIGVLGVALSLSVNLTLFVLVGLVYFVREIVLYLFVLMMPILIALWVPGVGPFTLVSGFVRRLAGFYVPFLFMTVPVAILFRLGEILGDSVTLSPDGIGAWITALVIPVVAVASPFVLFWQAGALLFTADRTAQHVSAERARRRATQATTASQSGAHHGRNFLRGVRGDGAIARDGTREFGSGDSRANRAGMQLRSRTRKTKTKLADRVARPTRDDASNRDGGLRERVGRGRGDTRRDPLAPDRASGGENPERSFREETGSAPSRSRPKQDAPGRDDRDRRDRS
ncbi:hypothetical protein ACFQFH_14990 [Halobaculum halobium]|uniref:Uncharacterized protein n=1 Tax=Halobaculum halobium TaxID=3032281 RepID=A0ABD5TFB6_9EURY|nr:hypothetical protein [Halobaculum sp. SYNS20]